MKYLLHTSLLFTLLFSFLLYNCGETNDSEDISNQNLEALEKQLVGKWKIRRRSNRSNNKNDCLILSIIFSANNSVLIENENSVLYGTYQFNSENSLNIIIDDDILGDITDILIEGLQVSFSVFIPNLCETELQGTKDLNYVDSEDCPLSFDVQIGNQTWMSKNLDVTRFNNGDPIPFEPNPEIWKDLTTPAYTFYANEIDNVGTYGILYNWYALNDERGVAPQGYRLPNSGDYKDLVTHLGLDILNDEGTPYNTPNSIAESLKSLGYWDSPNSNNNETCFSAVPAGFLASYDDNQYTGYGGLGQQAVFWTIEENTDNPEEAFHFILSYPSIGQDINGNLIQNNIALDKKLKTQGFSVRCIRD